MPEGIICLIQHLTSLFISNLSHLENYLNPFLKFFNLTKGFGFISPEGCGKDVFVHVSAVEAAGLRTLNEGQKVNFDIQPDARGSKAANLSAA